MAAELLINHSNYNVYRPGHLLYPWAQEQKQKMTGSSALLDMEPLPRKDGSASNGISTLHTVKRQVLADPRTTLRPPTSGDRPAPLPQTTGTAAMKVDTPRPPALKKTPPLNVATASAPPQQTTQPPHVQGNEKSSSSASKVDHRQMPSPAKTSSSGVDKPRLVPVEMKGTQSSPQPKKSTTEAHPSRKEEKKEEHELILREEKKSSTTTAMTVSTVLRESEIADLKRFHDNSLAVNSRKAYLSDYQSFIHYIEKRFPDIAEDQLQMQCTLEHVCAYINQQCNDGKKVTTVNRRLSTIRMHILPGLFHKTFAPGSREEQILGEMDAIVRGIRRTIGAEHRVRGKRPLLIDNIMEMCKVAARTTNDDNEAMPNKRSRDVSLLLFLFFSAMRRSEVQQLQWSDLTFDVRGVTVKIWQSKTDKEFKGQTIGISRLDGGERAAFCPVKALEAWREKSRGAGESPVFRWISKKDEIQWRVLIDQRIVAIVKHYADAIGLDSMCYAAHSTRSGYVTSSSDRGVPISEIQKRTRHKSLGSVAVYCKSEELFANSGDKRL